jgi:hypothetical protein
VTPANRRPGCDATTAQKSLFKRPRGSGDLGGELMRPSATQSFALLLQGAFQTVDSISQILEPTLGVDVEPIEDLYGVIVCVL